MTIEFMTDRQQARPHTQPYPLARMTRQLVNYIRLSVKLAMQEAREDKERKFTPVFWTGTWDKPVLIKLF